MTDKELIKKTIAFVKESLKDAEGGHDWFHIERVFNNAKLIAKGEKANVLVVSLGALLHDIADSKFHGGDETLGPKKAASFLLAANVDSLVIAQVIEIIKNSSFKASLTNRTGAINKEKEKTIELAIVQDADRLDAIGAIGVARCFNYGGFKNRAIYDPEILPNLKMTKEEYKASMNPSINHFYEKLLLLKDKMNTKTAKKIAKARHNFMESYLAQFYKEWQGKA